MLQQTHNGVLLPDHLSSPRVDDNVRDAYAAEVKRSNSALIAAYFDSGAEAHGEWCMRSNRGECPDPDHCPGA
jgi:hypothetical protein